MTTTTKIKTTFIFAAFILLSACSSAGGSGSSGTINGQTSPVIPPKPSVSGVVIANTITLDKKDATQGVIAKGTAVSTNVVVVGDKAISIHAPNTAVDTMEYVNANNMLKLVSGNHYLSYSDFGYVSEGRGKVATLFAQGTPSDTIPKTGSARYQGYAVQTTASAQSGKDLNLYHTTFNVDFGKKTITGNIGRSAPKVAGAISTVPSANINLSGTISGNGFSGTANGYTMQGGFYGDNAAEIAGVYQSDDKNTNGAFGAKR